MISNVKVQLYVDNVEINEWAFEANYPELFEAIRGFVLENT